MAISNDKACKTHFWNKALRAEGSHAEFLMSRRHDKLSIVDVVELSNVEIRLDYIFSQ